MKYKGGNEYNGEWKKDKKEGKGVFIYKSGSKYEGSFKNNVKMEMGYFIIKMVISIKVNLKMVQKLEKE